MLRFERATPEDAPLLAEVSRRAFHNDIHYEGPGEGGPPGYDSAEWQILAMNHCMYYEILFDDKIIGGFFILDKGDGHYELVRIFIDPDFQNQGIGTRTLEFMWQMFPEATKWTLDTPAWNLRTQHFYETMHFVKVGTRREGWGTLVLYEKRVAEQSS